MKTTVLQRVIFFGVPATVLALSFAAVCMLAGTPWPWNRVVHEDGVRTLLGTIFYFEHATRELLPDILLALAVAGAVRYFYPPRSVGGNGEASWWRRRLALGMAATLALILGGTAWSDGRVVQGAREVRKEDE